MLIRDLLVAALNVAVHQKKIDLHAQENIEGVFYFDLIGKPSKFSWSGIGYGELLVTLWWGIKTGCNDTRWPSPKPHNKNLKEALELCCSGWVEREEGLWLQGEGNKGLFDKYCSREASALLVQVPCIEPVKFEKKGAFFL